MAESDWLWRKINFLTTYSNIKLKKVAQNPMLTSAPWQPFVGQLLLWLLQQIICVLTYKKQSWLLFTFQAHLHPLSSKLSAFNPDPD